MTWRRRLAPAVIGAAVAAAVASIVTAITDPYAEKANDAYREGAQFGLVVRYVVLGAFFLWLIDLLARSIAEHGSLRAALATRGAPLLAVAALFVVVGLGVIPLFAGGYDEGDRRRDERAGFIPRLFGQRAARLLRVRVGRARGRSADRLALGARLGDRRGST